MLVEAKGIEPSSPACKTGVLPLNYAPKYLVDPAGVAPALPGCEPGGLLLILWTHKGQLTTKGWFHDK